MSIGSVSRGKRRLVVELDPVLAERLAVAMNERSSMVRRATASDILREALAAFLLPCEETDRFHYATKSSPDVEAEGSV